MSVSVSPVPNDAALADLAAGPGISVSARVPQPLPPQAAALHNFPAESDSVASDRNVAVIALALPTEIDATNSLSHCAQLCAAIDDGAQLVIADMTGTQFCDTSGFRMLLIVSQIAADHGTQFRVVIKTGTAVHRTLKMMGIDQVLSIYASLPDAMADSGH